MRPSDAERRTLSSQASADIAAAVRRQSLGEAAAAMPQSHRPVSPLQSAVAPGAEASPRSDGRPIPRGESDFAVAAPRQEAPPVATVVAAPPPAPPQPPPPPAPPQAQPPGAGLFKIRTESKDSVESGGSGETPKSQDAAPWKQQQGLGRDSGGSSGASAGPPPAAARSGVSQAPIGNLYAMPPIDGSAPQGIGATGGPRVGPTQRAPAEDPRRQAKPQPAPAAPLPGQRKLSELLGEDGLDGASLGASVTEGRGAAPASGAPAQQAGSRVQGLRDHAALRSRDGYADEGSSADDEVGCFYPLCL